MKSPIFGSGYFLEGFMPMQMLVEMALITGLFGLLAHISKKRLRLSKFSQAIGLPGCSHSLFEIPCFPANALQYSGHVHDNHCNRHFCMGFCNTG